MMSTRARSGGRAFARTVRAVAVVPVLLAVLAVTAGVSAAQSAATRSGDAVVVSPADDSKVVASGGSATEFTLALPDGAVCPGDSANDNYRVQSFLIPASADPGAIAWQSIGPSGDGQIALYKTDTNQFAQQLTEMNSGPGQPGIIPPVTALSFASYAPTDLTPGPHRMGIACTLYNTTTNYWDVQVDLARDSADQPAQIRWTVTSDQASSASSSSSRPAWLYVVLALLVLALVVVAALVVAARRRPPVAHSSKESR